MYKLAITVDENKPDVEVDLSKENTAVLCALLSAGGDNVATALAGRVLDEATAGMSSAEIEEFNSLVDRLRKRIEAWSVSTGADM